MEYCRKVKLTPLVIDLKKDIKDTQINIKTTKFKTKSDKRSAKSRSKIKIIKKKKETKKVKWDYVS